MKDKVLSAIALVGAFGLLLVFASPSYRQGERSQAGRTAPNFTFELNGQPTNLGSQHGKVVVLNFWATWCPPCVEEMPALNRLHAQLEPMNGMVLGVSVDKDEAAYRKFLADYGIRFPNHLDSSSRVASDYGSVMFPETYIIGPDGKIARKIIGPQQWDSAEWITYFRSIAKK